MKESFECFLKTVNKILLANLLTEQSQQPAREQAQEVSNSLLFFRAERKMINVFFQDILFIESLKDYIKIVTTTKTIITRYLLPTLEEMLPPNEFLRIHKSYIVAINKIDSYNTDSLHILKNELPIGRLYKFDVNRVLNPSSVSK